MSIPRAESLRACGAGFTLLVARIAWAGPLDALLEDPGAAEVFDYCAWAAGEHGELPDLTEHLAGTPEHQAAAALVDAGTQVALAAKSPKDCTKDLDKGRKVVEGGYKKALRALDRKEEHSDLPAVASVQRQITELWAADQAVRQVYVETRGLEPEGWQLWARNLAFSWATLQDERSTATLVRLVDEHGWIDANRYGGPVSQHAWLLAQHADDHPDVQAAMLTRMAAHLSDGGVRRRDYAYLYDRVAVNHGWPQRYGTQPIWECLPDGSLALAPLESPEHVDDRRADMGLGPVAEDLAGMARHFCGASIR